MIFFITSFLILLDYHVSAYNEYYIKLSNDGPVIVGANITFTAHLFTSEDKKPDGTFKYKWKDSLFPQHRNEFTENWESKWTVHYSPNDYKPGIYEVEVSVFTPVIIIDWPICSQRDIFKLNDLLVGEMILKQNSTVINTEYISNSTETINEIRLNPPDAAYLKNNASSITTYWFIDCIYIGNTSGLQFPYNYTVPDVSHTIDAFVDASHIPLPKLFSNVTNIMDTTSEVDIISSTSPASELNSDNITASSDNMKLSYITISNSTANNEVMSSVQSFNCSSKTISKKQSNHSYGLFSRKIKIKAPIENVKILGSGWLQHGEMLNLQVWCNGSAPFEFCFKIFTGYYNVTGNESCLYASPSSVCYFEVPQYFINSTHYTVLLIISNDINKYIQPFGVDVYEVTKHPQLSVIVVPISACIFAIVSIIFGIAYYIQNRNRYIVEVADFDFSNTNDMEYKTFRERLVEALHNAFNKTEDFSEQESYNGVPTNKKYGSMP